mmetsp:Transcript_21763/g.47184  ORF Transcript_21763/g.47184 Transcript_21763/m.47184 type:complete len:746 (+) Transcript_21763:261-2498(+)
MNPHHPHSSPKHHYPHALPPPQAGAMHPPYHYPSALTAAGHRPPPTQPAVGYHAGYEHRALHQHHHPPQQQAQAHGYPNYAYGAAHQVHHHGHYSHHQQHAVHSHHHPQQQQQQQEYYHYLHQQQAQQQEVDCHNEETKKQHINNNKGGDKTTTSACGFGMLLQAATSEGLDSFEDFDAAAAAATKSASTSVGTMENMNESNSNGTDDINSNGCVESTEGAAKIERIDSTTVKSEHCNNSSSNNNNINAMIVSKGILKRHPKMRGKQFARVVGREHPQTPLQREVAVSDGRSPTIDEACVSIDSGNSAAILEPSPVSAGPLKKRRQMDCAATTTTTDVAPVVSSGMKSVQNDALKLLHKKKKGNFMSEESDEAGDAKEEATRITSPVPSAVIDNGRVFPKTIHQLLSGNDITTEELFAVSSAMEWLPHGKGFRVLRWDDLSSKVLPVHFPDLCDGKEGSDEQWVDAFLLQISSWGFTEVKSGRDRGSFRHELFLRDAPELCDKMKCSDSSSTLSPTLNPDIGRSNSSLEAGVPWPGTSRTMVTSIFKPHHYTPSSYHDTQYQRVASSQSEGGLHPAYLHVPVLTSTNTWGSEDSNNQKQQQQPQHHPQVCSTNSASSSEVHFPRPYPPVGRSDKDGRPPQPKTIRFRDHPDSAPFPSRNAHSDAAPNEISPIDTTTMTPKSENKFVEHQSGTLSDVVMAQITPNPDINIHVTTQTRRNFPVSRRGGRGGLGMTRSSGSMTRHSAS